MTAAMTWYQWFKAGHVIVAVTEKIMFNADGSDKPSHK